MGVNARRAAVGAALGTGLGLLADALSLQSAVSYWGPVAPVVVAIALLAALVWLTRFWPAVAVSFGLVAALWLVVAFTPLTGWMAQGLVRRDPMRGADAVVVLASGLQPDGEMTAAAMSRLVHALEIVGQGRSPRLVLTELEPPSRAYAEPARALVRSLGLQAEILTVGPVRNTHDEAVRVADLFRTRGLASLVLVTSPTHTRRAAATFEKQGLAVVSSPAVETRFDLETLETSDDRVQAFGSLLHERIGLFVYRLRGQI